MFTEGKLDIQVSFPNDKAIYTLTIVPAHLYCHDPKGKTQDYYVIWD